MSIFKRINFGLIAGILYSGAFWVCIILLLLFWMVCGCEKEEPFTTGMVEVDKLTAEIELHGKKYKHSLSHVILPRERYKKIVDEAREVELGRIFTEGWEENIYIWTIPVYPYDGTDTVFGFSEPDELRLIKELAEINEARKLVDLYDSYFIEPGDPNSLTLTDVEQEVTVLDVIKVNQEIEEYEKLLKEADEKLKSLL